jgi:hypothetical protein
MAVERGGECVKGDANDASVNMSGDNAGEGRRALSMSEAAAKADVAAAEDGDDA